MISFLILLLSSLALGQVTDWQKRNYNTIRSIYNISIYPNSQAFFAKGADAVPDGLFAESATGRISPIGNFTGFLHSVEYFFGLTPIPSAPFYATWTNAKLVAFSSSCPEVASSVIYGETTGVNESHPETFGKRVTTIKQVCATIESSLLWTTDTAPSRLPIGASTPMAPYSSTTHGFQIYQNTLASFVAATRPPNPKPV